MIAAFRTLIGELALRGGGKLREKWMKKKEKRGGRLRKK